MCVFFIARVPRIKFRYLSALGILGHGGWLQEEGRNRQGGALGLCPSWRGLTPLPSHVHVCSQYSLFQRFSVEKCSMAFVVVALLKVTSPPFPFLSPSRQNCLSFPFFFFATKPVQKGEERKKATAGERERKQKRSICLRCDEIPSFTRFPI